jgi:hypothetical protein
MICLEDHLKVVFPDDFSKDEEDVQRQFERSQICETFMSLIIQF